MKEKLTQLLPCKALKFVYTLVLGLMLVVTTNEANAQWCAHGTAYGSGVASNGTGGSVLLTSCAYAGEYSTVTNIIAGRSYQVSSTITSDWITIRRDAWNGTLVSTATQNSIWVAPTSGTYYVHVSVNSACATQATCRNITITTVSLCQYGGLGYEIGAESAGYTAASACSNGSIPLGAGAYKDVAITGGVYYNFTAPSTFNNADAVRIVPNGTGSGGIVTLTGGQSTTGWYSGTATNIRVSTNRTVCQWSGVSSTLIYRHTTPTLTANSPTGSQTVCTGGSISIAGGTATNGTRYWQGTTSSGVSTGTPGSPNSASSNGTYYYRPNNNGCWGTQQGTTLTVVADPSIATHPSGSTICTGGSGSLIAAVTAGTGLSYQWEQWNGTAWVNVTGGTGATSTSFTTAALTATTQYRIRVNASGSGCTTPIYSNAATINIVADPTVTTNPTGITFCSGGTHSMSSAASNGDRKSVV